MKTMFLVCFLLMGGSNYVWGAMTWTGGSTSPGAYSNTYKQIGSTTVYLKGNGSNISYDTDKDKVAVESDIAKEMFRMRKKYENYVDILETSYIIIDEIEEEEKQRKEEEKIRKAEERAAKKKNNG